MALSNPYLVSAPVNVGVGSTPGTRTFYWSANLTLAPGFQPINFTVGHLSVSGVNHVTIPIIIVSTPLNSTITAVSVTYPTGYNMQYNAQFAQEGKSINYTNVKGFPDTPTLGESTAVFDFKNPGQDTITFTAQDTISKNQARTILAGAPGAIPFVTQTKMLQTGQYGTHGQLGAIDLISLVVLVVAMIGLNRVNETVGAIIMVMVIGSAAFFGLIQWPIAITAGVALVILIIVTSTKKLPGFG
jgi:hypothetical protein